MRGAELANLGHHRSRSSKRKKNLLIEKQTTAPQQSLQKIRPAEKQAGGLLYSILFVDMAADRRLV